jgi:hypothetical protein
VEVLDLASDAGDSSDSSDDEEAPAAAPRPAKRARRAEASCSLKSSSDISASQFARRQRAVEVRAGPDFAAHLRRLLLKKPKLAAELLADWSVAALPAVAKLLQGPAVSVSVAVAFKDRCKLTDEQYKVRERACLPIIACRHHHRLPNHRLSRGCCGPSLSVLGLCLAPCRACAAPTAAGRPCMRCAWRSRR